MILISGSTVTTTTCLLSIAAPSIVADKLMNFGLLMVNDCKKLLSPLIDFNPADSNSLAINAAALSILGLKVLRPSISSEAKTRSILSVSDLVIILLIIWLIPKQGINSVIHINLIIFILYVLELL